MRAILESRTITQLKKLIRDTNISGYSKLTKKEIINKMMKEEKRFQDYVLKNHKETLKTPIKKAPTHKMPDGKIMSGKTHKKDSKEVKKDIKPETAKRIVYNKKEPSKAVKIEPKTRTPLKAVKIEPKTRTPLKAVKIKKSTPGAEEAKRIKARIAAEKAHIKAAEKAEITHTPTPTPKPEPENKSELNVFYDSLDENATGSTRGYNKMVKLYGKDMMGQIFGAQKWGDFYSTPFKCLNIRGINQVIEKADNIIEGTAGLGSIVNHIQNINKKTNVLAIELNTKFVDFMKDKFKSNKKIKVVNADFFKETLPLLKGNNIDTIILNPPFSKGTKKDFYYDFLFRALHILTVSKAGKYPKDLIFISPQLEKDDEKNKGMLLMEHIYAKLSMKTFNTIFKNEFNKEPNKDLFKYVKDQEENKIKKNNKKEVLEQYELLEDKISVFDMELIDKCTGFGGTGVTANIYHIKTNYSY